VGEAIGLAAGEAAGLANGGMTGLVADEAAGLAAAAGVAEVAVGPSWEAGPQPPNTVARMSAAPSRQLPGMLIVAYHNPSARSTATMTTTAPISVRMSGAGPLPQP